VTSTARHSWHASLWLHATEQPSLLAELTGIDVVADFAAAMSLLAARVRFAGAFHQHLFGRPDTGVRFNIGGIANLCAARGRQGFTTVLDFDASRATP
jgi:anhydro-N-acetylmuramic acid kinase